MKEQEQSMAETRYPMCDDQPAQIDCRLETCVFHRDGTCTNISPAITLLPSGYFTCWSEVVSDDSSEGKVTR